MATARLDFQVEVETATAAAGYVIEPALEAAVPVAVDVLSLSIFANHGKQDVDVFICKYC
ncbi:hypothetical protein IW15_06675 [Chryseobacterium soli]|uniref:Uncharacterized protein n=1 Tax=Chryseobacterium soli TaxID=445961 RepID=A0A086A9V7_9FLAO|nr:hypothetical protein IW15_06675 [Chryseobacterium soli]